jgi:hypothetical protein
MQKRWNKRDERLAVKYRKMGMRFDEIGELLERTAVSVKSRLKILGCVNHEHYYTEAQKQLVRERYGRAPAREIAAELGRPVTQVYALAKRMGLGLGLLWQAAERQALKDYIAAHHAEEWSDAEIAAGWNASNPERQTNRRWVSEVRKDLLGLPTHGPGAKRYRLRVAANTRKQLERAGLPSIGCLRREAYRAFCVRSGWPQVTRPRLAQILNLLYEQGPHTLPQIAAAVGIRWRTNKKHPRGIGLPGNGPGGSYTAELMRLGLVVRLGRKARFDRGPGRARFIYAVAPSVVRGPVAERSEAS